MVRRFASLPMSLTLLLGLNAGALAVAQDDKKAEPEVKATPATVEAPKDQEPKVEPAGTDAGTPAEAPPPMQNLAPSTEIPAEVQAKLDAARKAVAEAIVAAQDANLVDTTISPPPILDILLLGKVDDRATLQQVVGKDVVAGVSLEVFGAWFTGQGKLDGIVPEKNIRIVPPSRGLDAYYKARAEVFNKYIAEARAAKGEPAAPTVEDQPAEVQSKLNDTPTEAPKEEMKDEPKTDTPATEEPKTDEPKTDEPKTDTPKTDEPKTDEPKTDEPKTDEPKTDEPATEEPKTEEPKVETPATEEPKTDEPATEEPKTEEPKVETPATEEPGTDGEGDGDGRA